MFAGVFSEQMLSLSSNALLDSRAILHVTCLVYHWPFLVTVLHFTLLAGVLHMYSCIAYHAHVPSSGFIFIKTRSCFSFSNSKVFASGPLDPLLALNGFSVLLFESVAPKVLAKIIIKKLSTLRFAPPPPPPPFSN